MAVIGLSLVLFLSLIICHYSLESAYPVPVFMWSQDSSLSPKKPLLAGHTLSAQDFQDKYLKNVLQKTQIVTLFIQDKLSIDDFSHYGDAYSTGSQGDAFSNLKFAIQKANSSVVLPSVDITSGGVTTDLVEYIQKNVKGQVNVVKEEELKSFKADNYPLNDKVTNVFIIHLHPVELSSPANAGLSFKQNDEVIAMVTKEIAKLHTPYTCILTAQAPNKDLNDQVLAKEISSLPHDRLRRDIHLDDASKGAGTVVYKNGSLIVDGNCILMVFRGLTFQRKTKKSPLKIDFFNTSDSSIKGTVTYFCPNSSGVSFDLNLAFGSFKLGLSGYFNRSCSDWKCRSLTATVNGQMGNESIDTTIKFPCGKELSVPRKMSYHCYSTTFKTYNYTLQFKEFQIQPDVTGRKFSYAYDCVGFFSIPILMGLFITGILLIILFFGIMAVFSITTMDRFDDPKGSSRSFGSTTG